jgi:hypothetical protein
MHSKATKVTDISVSDKRQKSNINATVKPVNTPDNLLWRELCIGSTRNIQHKSNFINGNSSPALIQRLCSGDCQEHQDEQAFKVQKKTTLSQPGDADELEADNLAEKYINSQIAAHKNLFEEESSQHVYRKQVGVEATKQKQNHGVHTSTAQGNLLKESVRRPFENFFNTDLSNVEIAKNSDANQSAKNLSARAYTFGNMIVFGEGEYAPHTQKGQKLLAHELVHIIQQRHSSNSRISRQTGPSANPLLSVDEMFNIITRERAWAFNPGGAQVCEDPRGVGRGVGASAGGRRAGSAVFTVMQITDASGRPVGLSYGDHISYGDSHAEQRAVAGLRRTIPIVRDVSGGRMTVVLDQVPCPPGRQNCMGLLQNFARERGLHLEVHVPKRLAMNSSRAVAPRTAAMSSMRIDTPPVTLERYHSSGLTPPTGSGSSGGSIPVSAQAVRTRAANGPIRLTRPTLASSTAIKTKASAIASLGNETQRSIRMSGRLSMIARGVTGLLGILGAIATLRSMQQIATHGTLFSSVESQVEQIGSQGSELHEWAISTTNNISFLEIMAAITDADERADSDSLFDIDSSLSDIVKEFREKHQNIHQYAQDLRAREAALKVMMGLFKDLVSIPMGASTASNADAFAMYVSLERLSGRVGSAANNFGQAAQQLEFYIDMLNGLANQANDNAWAIVWANIAVHMAEIDRETALNASIRKERRLNEIMVELEEIEARLNEPVCRVSEYYQPLLFQRNMLQLEKDSLRAQM